MQYHHKTRRRGSAPASLPGLARPRLWFGLKAVMALLLLSTLACTLFGPNVPATSRRIVMLTRLPTFTPTLLPALEAVTTDSTANVPTANPPAPDTAAAPIASAASPIPLTTLTSAPSGASVAVESLEPTDIAVTSPAPSSGQGSNPTATPLPPPTSTPAEAATTAPTAPPTTAPEEPPPASGDPTATPAPKPAEATAGWTFANTRIDTGQDEAGLLLYGELINDTGASQELFLVSGTFYDEQGQVIAGQDSTDDYAPLEVIPPGGRIPFEMTVSGIQSAANFDLWVRSETSSDTPRRDFEFLEVEQWSDREDYCFQGLLRNPGAELQEYLVVIAVLYDGQDNVVNFGHDYQANLEGVAGDETLDFEICVAPPNQNVSRHELQAWGH